MKSQRDNALNFLAKCFSGSEWEWLLVEEEFQEALKSVTTIEEAERKIVVGIRLLTLARTGQLRSGRRLPESVAL